LRSLTAAAIVALSGIVPLAHAEAVKPQAGPVHLTTMISVTNLDKSIDYYTRLIGMKEATRVPLGNGGFEVILSPSGRDWDSAIGLLYTPSRKEPFQHGTSYNRLAVFLPTAEEVDTRTKRIADEGYKIVVPPTTSTMMNTGGKRVYRFSHFKDPDGYTVEFTYFDPDVK
jgi:lactoylglutathione lyase